jgi:hypothetical protein
MSADASIPASGGEAAIRAAGLSVNSLALESPSAIRSAVPTARSAALAVKPWSESPNARTGYFTGMPVVVFQNWLYERNRHWRLTDGALCVLWCLEFPDARCDYAERFHYVASTRREYNAGRHGAPAPSTPSVAYQRGLASGGRIVQQLPAAAALGAEVPVPRVPLELPTRAPAGSATIGPPNRVATDPEATRRRLSALQAYIEAEVLAPTGTFVCSSFAACRSSHAGLFYEGQLHHVGQHFDASIDGHPFRIAVVGQDYGQGPARRSLAWRYNDVAVETGLQKRFTRADGLPGRNPHMRGTTSLLRLLFGKGLGRDHRDEFVTTAAGELHLYDLFALTDFLLCSAIDADSSSVGSKHSRSTPVMRKNCGRHFARTIEILEPTLVVVQGVTTWQWMQGATAVESALDDTLQFVRIGSHPCLAMRLSHPSAASACWADLTRPYLLDVVVPAVNRARAVLFDTRS